MSSSTFDPDSALENKTTTQAELLGHILAPSSIVTNCISLIYIIFYLKINSYVSTLLKLDAAFKIGCCFVWNFAFFAIQLQYDIDKMILCSLNIMSCVSALVSSYYFQPAIAVVRYHLADRMAKQRFPQSWYLNLVTATATLAMVLIISLFAMYIFYFQVPFGPFIQICMRRRTDHNRIAFGPATFMFLSMASLMIGLCYDIKMYRFLKQRKKHVQPGVAMIAWKPDVPTVSYGSNSSLKATVPIKATCLGAVNLMVCLPTLLVFVKGFKLISVTLSIFQVSGMLIVTCHMPLILLLTVKSNAKKASPPLVQPPVELQFHD